MGERENGMFYAWRRYWARGLDLFIYGLLWAVLTVLVFHINIADSGIDVRIMNTVMQLALMVLMEPLLLHFFGTTPGKAILGIRVVREDGGMLTVAQGFSRTIGVLIKGMGLSIPIYSLYTNYKSYGRCSDQRIQPWDEGISYTIKDTKRYRWLVYVAANAAVFGSLVVVAMSGQLPPNRGKLTVAEFAENYNYLAGYYNVASATQSLGADGKWQDETVPGEYHIAFSDMETPEFIYEVKNGYITGISFLVEERNRDEALPLFDTEAMLAVLAFTGAQKGAGIFNNDRGTIVDWIGASYFRDYHIVYRGVDITCERESKGYRKPISWLLIPEQDAENLYYRTEFRMRLDDKAQGVKSPVCVYGD